MAAECHPCEYMDLLCGTEHEENAWMIDGIVVFNRYTQVDFFFFLIEIAWFSADFSVHLNVLNATYRALCFYKPIHITQISDIWPCIIKYRKCIDSWVS